MHPRTTMTAVAGSPSYQCWYRYSASLTYLGQSVVDHKQSPILVLNIDVRHIPVTQFEPDDTILVSIECGPPPRAGDSWSRRKTVLKELASAALHRPAPSKT